MQEYVVRVLRKKKRNDHQICLVILSFKLGKFFSHSHKLLSLFHFFRLCKYRKYEPNHKNYHHSTLNPPHVIELTIPLLCIQRIHRIMNLQPFTESELNQPTNQNHPNQNQNHKTTNTQAYETTTKPELFIMIPIEIHSSVELADYVMISFWCYEL